MVRLIIDRFESDYAVCEMEDRSFINIPKNKLPLEAKEGDCITLEDGSYSLDYERTIERKRAIEEKFRRLLK